MRLPRSLLSLATLGGLLCIPAMAAPPLPAIPAGTFNVTTYGAVGNGTTDNTAAIQAALDAAKNAGGGTVRIPAAAQAYLCGPIAINSSTHLQIDAGATLQALPFGTYPKSTSSPSHFITVNNNSTHVKISGGGTIDGNGTGWWAAFNAGTISTRPRLIQVNRTDTFQITGITLSNSPMFHLAFSATNNVTIDGVTIIAPSDAPNSDAIDPAGVHYLIQNCNLSVGDDNIAIKPGSTFCGDFVITNCAFGTGHGLSIGGQTNVGLDGMTVSNCTFNGTTSGLRMKADVTEGGLVQNVTYSNLTMTNVQYPIVFYSYYNQVGTPGAVSGSNQTTPTKVANWNANPPDSLKASTISIWRNITIDGLTATGARGYSILWGLPLSNALISNVVLNNVSITGTGTYGFEIFNAENVRFTGTTNISQFVSYNALAITLQPQSQTVNAGANVMLSVTATGTSGINSSAPSYQWKLNGTPLNDGAQADGTVISGAGTANLTLTNVKPGKSGNYTVMVSNSLDTYDAAVTTLKASNTAVSATSSAAVLTVNDTTSTTPLITVPPQSQVVAAGTNAGFSVTATGAGPFTYQWRRNGSAIAGATGSVYTITSVQLGDAGQYSVVVGSPTGSTTSTPAPLAVSAATPGGDSRLVAIACRAVVGTGGDVLIPGIIVGGSGKRSVIVRAKGPAIDGVPGTLAKPQLQLVNAITGLKIAENIGWDTGTVSNTNALKAAFAQVGLPQLPAGSADCALLADLDAGAAYTAVMSGVNNTTGVGLVEVYELGNADARITALACRARVGTGDNILIPGIIIAGSSPKQVLVRASAPVGVSGTLDTPHLELNDGSAKIAENTGWSTAGNAAAVFTATSSCGLVNFPTSSASCAILVTLPPGGYTALVSGVGATTGVALIEVYEVP